MALLALLLSALITSSSASAAVPGGTAGLSGRVLNGSAGLATQVQACLLGGNNSCLVTYTAASDAATGQYAFTGIPAGSYRVSADTPAGRWHAPAARTVTAVAGRQVTVADFVFVERAPAGTIDGTAYMFDPTQQRDLVVPHILRDCPACPGSSGQEHALFSLMAIPVNPNAPRSGRTGWTESQPWMVDVDPGTYRVRIEFAGNGQIVWRDAVVESNKTTVLSDVHVPPAPPVPQYPEPISWSAGAVKVRAATPSNNMFLTGVVWPAYPFLAAASYTVTAAPGGRKCTMTAYSGKCTITGLTPGTSYSFYAEAKSLYGYTSGRSTLSQSRIAAGPPSPVRAPNVTYSRGGVATVRWTAPVRGGGVDGWPVGRVFYTAEITRPNTTIYVSSKRTLAPNTRFTGLRKGATYRVRLHASNGVYEGPPFTILVRPTM